MILLPLLHIEPCPFTSKAHILAPPTGTQPKVVAEACDWAYDRKRLKLNADYEALWDTDQAELNAELQHAAHWCVDCLLYTPQAPCADIYRGMYRWAMRHWYEKRDALFGSYTERVVRMDVDYYGCLQ